MPTNLILSSKEEFQCQSYLSSKNINDNFELQNSDIIYINKIDGNLIDGFEIRGKLKIKVSMKYRRNHPRHL